ncbi:MAG: DUF1800 domain-containing protein, partial [Dehalococcoidia bacterium]
LLHPERVPDDEAEARFPADRIDYDRPTTIGLWWLARMVTTRRPLQEKMTLFWHGHLTSALSRVRRPLHFTMVNQNAFFRANALGNFHDIVLGVSKEPAMILWLDNNTNRRGKPNENYARELFELFTLGRGAYSEEDIREAARAFTGWFQRNGEFAFTPNQHDNGQKTIFGQTGNWDGTDVVSMAVSQSAAGPFMARKLWEFFVYPNPEQSVVDAIARVYESGGYDIRAVMHAIFTHSEFYSERAYHALVKSPAEIMIGFFRSLEADLLSSDDPQTTVQLANQLQATSAAMGQVLFNPPNVAGWPGGDDWISTTALITRYNFAERAVRNGYPAARFDIARLLQQRNLTDAPAIVDHFLDLMVDGDVTAAQRQTLLDYVTTNDNGTATQFQPNDATINKKVRGLIHLIATTPQYQLA